MVIPADLHVAVSIYYASVISVFFHPYLPSTQGLFELLLLSLHLPIIKVVKPYRPESNPTYADYYLGDFDKVNFFVGLNLQISKIGLFMCTCLTRLLGVSR